MADLPVGVRRTAKGGYRADVWVVDPTRPKGGYQAGRNFDPGTSLTEIREWRKARSLNLTPDGARVEVGTLFADDARDYLARDKVAKMPTSQERHLHIREWIAVFGRRERKTIQPQEIQKALDDLRARMSAGSVNKRRTALMDLWTTLDGRHQANPVKATTVYEEPTPEPRAPALAQVLAILNAMPTNTDYARKCRARIRVIAWTGWPHAIVKQIAQEDREHWRKEKRAFVRRRKKGKGARARWLPLLPEAVKALEEFHKEDAYGHFSNSPLWKKVTGTCDALKMQPRVRPYDFRHFFGTLIATITKDERAVQELMLLSTAKQARRYTEAATDPRVQAAVSEVSKHLPGLRKAASRLAESGRVSRDSVSPTETARVPVSSRNPRKH